MGSIRLQGGHQEAVKLITRGLPPAVAATAALNSSFVLIYNDAFACGSGAFGGFTATVVVFVNGDCAGAGAGGLGADGFGAGGFGAGGAGVVLVGGAGVGVSGGVGVGGAGAGVI